MRVWKADEGIGVVWNPACVMVHSMRRRVVKHVFATDEGWPGLSCGCDSVSWCFHGAHKLLGWFGSTIC